jgi:hypothetical protein
MSGLETLPPDQRAVLQLILQQGRGYAELAGMLKIDIAAVRERAHAGLDALAGASGATPAPEQRARIADYLLGQQDAAERLVTFAELGDAADASRWAGELRDRLAPLAHEALPEVPATGATNGRAVASAAPAAASTPAAPAPVAHAPASEPAPAAAPPTGAGHADAGSPPTPRVAPATAGSASPRRPSRTGGALLIGGVLVAVVVLAIVLLNGGGGGGGKATDSATTSATAAGTATTPATVGGTGTTAPQATVVAQVNLSATPGNGSGVGLGIVERGQGGKQAIAIAAQKLAPNGAKDIYAAWLQGPPGSHFLGFVPARVGKAGGFTASAALPGDARRYTSVLITREPTTRVPKTPGPTVLSGSLKLP